MSPSAVSLIHRCVPACSERVPGTAAPIPALWPSLKSGGSCLRVLRALGLQPGWVQGSGTVLLNADREMQLSWGRALPARLLHAPPEVQELPDSTAAIPSPTQVWVIVCRYRSGLPPGLADSLPRFSQETINPTASGRHWLSSSSVLWVQPLRLSRPCQPGCFGAE